MKQFSKLLFTGLCLLANVSAAERPNIILAMADDMGWHDISTYGNDRVATPNIDRLAKEGLKMTQFYSASAVCSPTRASVLTGRYPLRFNITGHFNDRGQFLPETHTLPKLLKAAGYGTAHVGKWHLGGLRTSDTSRRNKIPGPRQHGFDHYLTQREEQPLRGKMGRERTLFRKDGKPVELFDIDSDLTEKHKVLEEHPTVAQELQKQLGAWLAEPRQQFGNIKD